MSIVTQHDQAKEFLFERGAGIPAMLQEWCCLGIDYHKISGLSWCDAV
jgi:hypothetical protein